jgi:hypothetical protein
MSFDTSIASERFLKLVLIKKSEMGMVTQCPPLPHVALLSVGEYRFLD